MDEASPTRTVNRRVLALSVAALAPVAVTLLLATVDVRGRTRRSHLPCPLYPNAVVAFAAELHESCPLEPGDVILGTADEGHTQPVESARDLSQRLAKGGRVELVLHRSGESGDRRIEVVSAVADPTIAWSQLGSSMLLVTILLSFALLTTVRSGVPAAAPFAWIHASVGVLIVSAIAGWTSPLSYPLTALARAVLPASLIHVAFVFPRTREVTLRVPGIQRVSYWIALGVFLLELDATYRGASSTMLLLQRMGMAAVAVAILLLCFSSWLSMRESPSRLERGQAKMFLNGVFALVAVTFGVVLAGLPGGALTAVTLGVAAFPIPLGYAIARYHLFDFGTTLLRIVAHLLYLSIWSGLFFLAVVLLRDRIPMPEWLRHPMVLLAGVYVVLTPLDGFRQLLRRSIERAFRPEVATWAKLSEGRAARIAHLRDVDSIGRAAVVLASEGLPNAGVSLFLGGSGTLRLAHAAGPGACEDPAVAALSQRLASGKDVIDLNRFDTVASEAATVFDAGVEIVSMIAAGGTTYGVMLVCPQRRDVPHPLAPITWLRLIGVHTAAALENARLAEQLRESEQFAIRGRMHAELAHEIGKPLGALERLANKLASDPEASGQVHERASSIARISGQLRAIVRGVLDGGSGEQLEVTDLIERACLEIASVHGAGAVTVRPLPQLPPLDRGAERAVRALTNLIDNAIRANAPGEAVEIRVRSLGTALEIEVADRGAGIAPDDLARVFDAFVSLRPGGHGLGLTISRQIVEQLGGAIALESELGRGTVARLRLPVAPGR